MGRCSRHRPRPAEQDQAGEAAQHDEPVAKSYRRRRRRSNRRAARSLAKRSFGPAARDFSLSSDSRLRKRVRPETRYRGRPDGSRKMNGVDRAAEHPGDPGGEAERHRSIRPPGYRKNRFIHRFPQSPACRHHCTRISPACRVDIPHPRTLPVLGGGLRCVDAIELCREGEFVCRRPRWPALFEPPRWSHADEAPMSPSVRSRARVHRASLLRALRGRMSNSPMPCLGLPVPVTQIPCSGDNELPAPIPCSALPAGRKPLFSDAVSDVPVLVVGETPCRCPID